MFFTEDLGNTVNKSNIASNTFVSEDLYNHPLGNLFLYVNPITFKGSHSIPQLPGAAKFDIVHWGFAVHSSSSVPTLQALFIFVL